MVHADSSGRTLDQTRRALWTPESTHTLLGCRVGCQAWNRQRRPSKRFRDISDIKIPFAPVCTLGATVPATVTASGWWRVPAAMPRLPAPVAPAVAAGQSPPARSFCSSRRTRLRA